MFDPSSPSGLVTTDGVEDGLLKRLDSGVHADAIMDRIVHNTIWVDTGNHNMREHAAVNQ